MKYINRELSWLEFNQRVLEEARQQSLPLLERIKFLAITASNLDEFFMVRVGSLRILVEQGTSRSDPTGMSPMEQLSAISSRTHQMVREQYQCFLTDLEPRLAEQGIRRIPLEELTEVQLEIVSRLFNEEIFSVLTPLAVTGAEDFPLLGNHNLNLAVQLKPSREQPEVPRFAVIPFGRSVSRFVTLPSVGGYSYILLEEVIRRFVDRFFPGESVIECVPFRITRNADMNVQEDNAADLLEEMVEVLDARKISACVRLEVSDRVTSRMLSFLQTCLAVPDEQLYVCPGPIELSGWFRFADLKGFDALKYPPWPPRSSPLIEPGESILGTLRQRDVLLFHPYESFEPVIRFLEEAADDPDVLAIKQTLYRTSGNSPIIAALARAAEKGKTVTVIVELKARFDEARNIEWARKLEQAGVQVIYGVKGLKTHAKLAIVVRREAQGIQRYAHFGTGNYNENTSRIYSDVSYMTCDEDLMNDASSFFNAITGYSHPMEYRKIEAAPIGLRAKLLELIESETARKKQGQKAFIQAKLNSLVDPELIDALYRASAEGVKIRLNVRGICCLKPGRASHNKNITVISIIDRFLEHARILHFHHGGDDRVFISSADWMPRNLDRRVELLVPVDDPPSRDRLISILKQTFKDNVKARRLTSSGSYIQQKTKGDKNVRSQEAFYQRACELLQDIEQSRRTVFEPHRAPGDEE